MEILAIHVTEKTEARGNGGSYTSSGTDVQRDLERNSRALESRQQAQMDTVIQVPTQKVHKVRKRDYKAFPIP